MEHPTKAKEFGVFKHILVPVDGSAHDALAAKTAIELAAVCGASIYALHVVPSFNSLSYLTAMLAASEMVYDEQAKALSQKTLDAVKAVAAAAGVDFEGGSVSADHPYGAILDAVKTQHCDLVVMSFNERHGMDRLLLGSETHKVLINADVPVLVCR